MYKTTGVNMIIVDVDQIMSFLPYILLGVIPILLMVIIGLSIKMYNLKKKLYGQDILEILRRDSELI